MKTGLLRDAIFPLLSALHNETRAVIDRARRLGLSEAVNECQAGEGVSECHAGEGVNECQAGDSPPDTGGVAAPSRKRCEATAAAQTGWSELTKCFGMHSLERVPFLNGCALASACAPRSTTPSAPLKEASRLLLDVASTPPVSGGELPASDSFRQQPRKRRGMDPS